jgi:hypothetical protein
LVNRTIKIVKLLVIYSLVHSPVTSSLLGPNVFFITLFSNTHSVSPSLRARSHCAHPYRTTDKNKTFGIFYSLFLANGSERLRTEWWEAFPKFVSWYDGVSKLLLVVPATCLTSDQTIGQ